ncbi:hypothetical protein [Thauera mechernichensis]
MNSIDPGFLDRREIEMLQHTARLEVSVSRTLGTGVRHLTPTFAPFRKVPSAPARVSRP